jgi:alanyl-tRNA synthetase
MASLIETAEAVTGRRLGDDELTDLALRVLAEHARTMTLLISDGVFPSNEDRGYVLRRIMRRAVRYAYLLGVDDLVTPRLVDAVVELTGDAYPELRENHQFVRGVVEREEKRFRETLRTGSQLLDAELARVGPAAELPGSVAFQLHDTYGFPLEVTEEIVAERGGTIDRAGFDVAMAGQRQRAKAAAKFGSAADDTTDYGAIAAERGTTEFVGRDVFEISATVVAAVPAGIVLDRTPFYAESGGQIGDTGSIAWAEGSAAVVDTTYGAPGLILHRVAEGTELPAEGTEVRASIDIHRRDAIRRNHTATHLVHQALRAVLGDHVKQQGSLVGPDHLRFDFSHYDGLTADQIAAVESMVNAEILANPPARHFETTMDHAKELGAVAFFGDKYGDIVRVLEAGPHSIELCGGTHVKALGDIGAFKIVSEGSIGSNIRRIEAVTGMAPIERLRRQEARLAAVAEQLGVADDDIESGLERRLADLKTLRRELDDVRRAAAVGAADDYAATAVDGVVVARVDDLDRDGLRDLAVAIRDRAGIRAVVLGTAPAAGGVALVSAANADGGLDAGELIADASKLVKGGGGRNPELSVAGGKDPGQLDAALDAARAAAGI